MDNAIYDKDTGLLIEYPVEQPKGVIDIKITLEAWIDIMNKINKSITPLSPNGWAGVRMFGRDFAASCGRDSEVNLFAQDREYPHMIVLKLL